MQQDGSESIWRPYHSRDNESDFRPSTRPDVKSHTLCAMGTFKFLRSEIKNSSVAVVRLARPPVNAIDRDMYIEIARLFSNPDLLGSGIRAIVLTGEGRHFCAGNDLDEFASMTPENGVERMWRVREAFFAIQDCPVPVIGAIHGAALGTGVAIAASCDFVIAARDARFGLPELTVGVMGGARHLARFAPGPLVRRMFFTGEQLSAEQLAEASGGLVVCEPEQLLDRACAVAARIASFSPTAVRLAKSVLNRIETMDLKAGYELEQSYTVKMSGHPDSQEALQAFRQKREPTYLPLTGAQPPID
jgi:enoyl-CoA hydratase